MFNNFFGFAYQEDPSIKLNPFIEKMEKGELSLEDILTEDCIIQDIKQNTDSKFIDFLKKDKIQKLIDYSTKFPSEDEHNIGYKYPFNATEILCSDNTNFQNNLMEEIPYKPKSKERGKTINIAKGHFIFEIFQVLGKIVNDMKKDEKNGGKKIEEENEEKKIEEENYDEERNEEGKENDENADDESNTNVNDKKVIYENIDYLLQFLNESEKTKDNYVLVGYFSKIINSLINIHQTKIVEYFLDYPRKDEFDIIKLFIKNMKRKGMCNIIQKLLIFESDSSSKYDEKKKDLILKIFDELESTDIKEKYESIGDSICTVMNNRTFFDLFMTKKQLLEKLYNIIFNCKDNDKKYNSVMKILIKINDNIIQHFPVHYTDTYLEMNNNDMMPYNMDMPVSIEKSSSSPEDNESIKKFILTLFEILENNEFNLLEDFCIKSNDNQNNEFTNTFCEKQKKIGMKKILQVEYLKTIVDIFINSYASKYHENKIENLIKILSKKNIFWNLHEIFMIYSFSNIYQIHYNQIMKLVMNENCPDYIIDAFFKEENNNKRNIIEFYLDKLLKDMEFNFKKTKTKSFNPLISFIVTILNGIYTSQNLYIKSFIGKNDDLSMFYEIIGEEMENIFNQRLLLPENSNFGAFDLGEEDDATPQTFGPLNFMQIFEEDCKIFELYKKGEDYKKVLYAKKERIEKEKEEKKKKEKEKENDKKGLDYIDDIEEEDDPLYKVQKVNINDLKKQKDNFLALLNKPTEEVNMEEENNDVIVDNAEKEDDNKNEKNEKFKGIWEDDEEKEKEKEDNKDNDKKNEENEENK